MNPTPSTFEYKRVKGVPICLDIFEPILATQSEQGLQVPAVVFFHGGGLTVGNRTNWFPTWLRDRAVSSGFAFISADYQLIPPSSGHDIVQDIKDLFHFLEHRLNSLLQKRCANTSLRLADSTTPDRICTPFQIDPNAIAVAGCSAGGLCAYLAAIHASPKPTAVVSFYGMGGNFLTPHYFSPKTKVFFRGREMLDPKDFMEFLHPSCTTLPVIADSPLSYHPSTYMIPGYPSNPRMLLARLYLQMGIFLDYFTDIHEPSLSFTVRNAAAGADSEEAHETLKSLVPETALSLFPQFNINSSWPPTFLAHGAIDSAVPSKESSHIFSLLQGANVESTLRIMDGLEHSFDYVDNAKELFGQEGGLFDEVGDFLRRHLCPQTNLHEVYGVDYSEYPKHR